MMIEPEDKLGEECKKELEIIRFNYKLLEEKIRDREIMFRYQVEGMMK